MNKFQSLTKLFWLFFKVGSFTFGGGYAMLPLIQKEVVDNRHWVGEEEMVDILAISQSTPGVISINTAIFIGNKVAALPGAIAAALGMILPAFISILLILIVLLRLKNNVYVGKVFSGIRAASAGLILLAAIRLGKSILKGRIDWLIALASFIIIVFFNINAAWAVILGAMAGFTVYLWNGRKRPN